MRNNTNEMKGGVLVLELDMRSRAPIYEQLVEKFKELIIKNVLKPDEKLPTVRELASQLTINPNTVQKAYRELEHLGFIYSLPGKGNFVKAAAQEHSRLRLKELEDELNRTVAEMLYLGKSGQDILSLVAAIIPDSRGREDT